MPKHKKKKSKKRRDVSRSRSRSRDRSRVRDRSRSRDRERGRDRSPSYSDSDNYKISDPERSNHRGQSEPLSRQSAPNELMQMRQVIAEQRSMIDQLLPRRDANVSRDNDNESYGVDIAPRGMYDDLASCRADTNDHEISDSDASSNSGPSYEEAALLKESQSDKKGDAIDRQHLEFVNRYFGKECTIDMVKKVKSNYLEPENTNLLSGKDVNPEIDNALQRPMKRRDLSIKIVQHNLGAAATATIKSMTKLKQSTSIPDDIRSDLAKINTDALVLLAKSMHDLTIIRKQLVKAALNPKYADQLVAKSTYESKLLFGDNLGATIKSIEDTSSATSNITKYVPRGRGYNNSSYGRYTPRGSRPFLGRGRPYYRRGQSHNYQPMHYGNQFQQPYYNHQYSPRPPYNPEHKNQRGAKKQTN